VATGARFVHVNIVARDWKRLARFYQRVFGCTLVPPERDLAGQWLDDATGIPSAQIRGVHLRLPDYGDEGPTLEIFQYEPTVKGPEPVPNRPGLAHIAFAVEDVELIRNAVVEAGGGAIGDLVAVEIPGTGRIEFVYVTDPEGNILELQHWSR
jgi:predicted enzyme related to lactoylglutathione lyase